MPSVSQLVVGLESVRFHHVQGNAASLEPVPTCSGPSLMRPVMPCFSLVTLWD